MTRVAEGKPAARRRAKRLLVRSAARPRRKIIWTELKRRAAARGFAPQELERFYHYLSTHLKLEEPEYVEPLQKPPNHFPGLRAQPVYDPSEFAWIPRLVDDFENIRQEVLDFSATLTLDAQPQGLDRSGSMERALFLCGRSSSRSNHARLPPNVGDRRLDSRRRGGRPDLSLGSAWRYAYQAPLWTDQYAATVPSWDCRA